MMDTLDYDAFMGIPAEIQALFDPDTFIDLSIEESVSHAREIFRTAWTYFPTMERVDPDSHFGRYLGPLFVLATVWGPNPSAIGFWEWLGAATMYLHPEGVNQPGVRDLGTPTEYLTPFATVPDDVWDMDAWRPLVHQYPLSERLVDAARIAQVWRPSIAWDASDLTLPLLALVLLDSPFAGNGSTTRLYFGALREALRRAPVGRKSAEVPV